MNGVRVSERLRELREKAALSHKKLADSLKETYDINIAEQTLKDYERPAVNGTTENITKGKAIFGMRIEYLDMFADYYGVSTDYILGRTDIKKPSPDVLSACSYTGLSEQAAFILHEFAKEERETLNAVITSPHFKKMIQEIFDGGKNPGIQSNAIKAVIKNALSANPDKDIQALRPIINKDFDGLFRNGAINAANKLYDEVSETIWKEAEKHGKH